MKKVFLLIALVCAGQMYGMENPQPELSVFQNLPNEVKNLIVLAFAQSGNDLDSAIENIKIASRTNKTLNQMVNLGNLKGFTAIVAQLQKKFQEEYYYRLSRKQIAEKFNTPVAKEYVTLGDQLLWPANLSYDNPAYVEDIKKLLAEGADPNYSGGQIGDSALYATHLAIMNDRVSGENPKRNESLIAILKLLLDAGAKPDANFMFFEQKRVTKRASPVELRKELFDLLKQYADK